MKLSVSLSLIVAAAAPLVACSSDEGAERTPSAAIGSVAAAGAPANGAAAPAAGAGGSASVAAAGAPAVSAGGTSALPAPTTFTYGPALTITADGNVVDETGTSGVDGGFFLAQSTNMTVVATTANKDGSLCFSGSTKVVPDATSYGTYWGAELALDLKRVPIAGAAAPAPAAAGDAGVAAPTLMAGPWPYGDVIGFSYKLVGQDAAAPDKGVPPARLRFKALPVGSNGANDTYCSLRDGVVDQQVENVLFSDISFECWSPGNPTIGPDDATINRVNPVPTRVVETPPNPKALTSISWQVSSDIAATTPAPIAFNFCITELKPILAQ